MEREFSISGDGSFWVVGLEVSDVGEEDALVVEGDGVDGTAGDEVIIRRREESRGVGEEGEKLNDEIEVKISRVCMIGHVERIEGWVRKV